MECLPKTRREFVEMKRRSLIEFKFCWWYHNFIEGDEMKTYRFKLYHSARSEKIHKQINAAGLINNHCIALHKRCYKIFGKCLNKHNLQKHLVKLKKIDKFGYIKETGSQAVQNITDRIDRAFQSRRISGKVKTVTIKRDSLGDFYVFIVTDAKDFEVETRTGKIVGFDFGLKNFLTSSDGKDIICPLFFEQNSAAIKFACKNLSHKVKGSNNRRKSVLNLARLYKKSANQRHDFHFKMARQLCLE